MVRERQSLLDGQTRPHSVSLKVLRLSRASLTTQSSPPQNTSPEISEIPAEATPNYPTGREGEPFVLNPLLDHPQAFGPAYVGEIFSCTVCLKNELSQAEGEPRLSGVRVLAEMQTPSQTLTLELDPAGADMQAQGDLFQPGQTLQKIVRFDLKEQGNHVLAITVAYTETGSTGGQASNGSARTFRKLFQFMAQQCLAVRTKTVELAPLKSSPDRGEQSGGRLSPSRLLLEAQLENMSQELITLETVHLNPRPPLQSTSLNWDVPLPTGEKLSSPRLNPREVVQVAFLIQPNEQSSHEIEDAGPLGPSKDGRMILGQLNLEWCTTMGDRGVLTTGWLTFRKR